MALQSNMQKFSLLFPGKSKEAEIKRINKELANIRSKFKGKRFNLDRETSCEDIV